MKKTLVDEIRQWATLAAFCAAAVLFYLNNAKLDRLEKAAIESQTFRTEQGKLNVQYEFVLNFVVGDIKKRMEEEDEEGSY